MDSFKLNAIEKQILECQSELRYLYSDGSAKEGVVVVVKYPLILSFRQAISVMLMGCMQWHSIQNRGRCAVCHEISCLSFWHW